MLRHSQFAYGHQREFFEFPVVVWALVVCAAVAVAVVVSAVVAIGLFAPPQNGRELQSNLKRSPQAWILMAL